MKDQIVPIITSQVKEQSGKQGWHILNSRKEMINLKAVTVQRAYLCEHNEPSRSHLFNIHLF